MRPGLEGYGILGHCDLQAPIADIWARGGLRPLIELDILMAENMCVEKIRRDPVMEAINSAQTFLRELFMAI